MLKAISRTRVSKLGGCRLSLARMIYGKERVRVMERRMVRDRGVKTEHLVRWIILEGVICSELEEIGTRLP